MCGSLTCVSVQRGRREVPALYQPLWPLRTFPFPSRNAPCTQVSTRCIRRVVAHGLGPERTAARLLLAVTHPRRPIARPDIISQKIFRAMRNVDRSIIWPAGKGRSVCHLVDGFEDEYSRTFLVDELFFF